MDAQVLIIGAGLSGLIAAHTLKEAGVDALVLDKGTSVGGRLATRRIQEGLADHGAQFFTVRTVRFQSMVDQWLKDDLVRVWGYGWSDGSLKRTANDGHPRYVANGGMNALAKYLEQGLNIKVGVEVTSVAWGGHSWMVTDTQETVYHANHLIMTPPVPQTLELLKKGQVELDSSEMEALESIAYGPCLCAMFVVNGDVNLPEPGALQDFTKTVYWIADNQRKGISNQRIITLHTEARYSREHYNDPDSETLAFLQMELEKYLTEGSTLGEGQLKKWRYSVPLTTYPHDWLETKNFPLVFAGDAFGGRGRMEGAFYSGVKSAHATLERLGKA